MVKKWCDAGNPLNTEDEITKCCENCITENCEVFKVLDENMTVHDDWYCCDWDGPVI